MFRELSRRGVWLVGYPLLSRITDLEGLHSGEDCYIFGDGHSIKYFDLSRFNDKIGLAVNCFPCHVDFELTDTRYWVIAEPGLFMPPILNPSVAGVKGIRNRLRFQGLFKRKPRDGRRLVRITSLPNCIGDVGRNTYHFFDRLPSRDPAVRFESSKDSFAGSICAVLTIARYMGFKRAYLVGFDYTHNPRTSFHWYEAAPPLRTPQEPRSYHPEFFDEIQRHMEVITVTPVPQETELRSVDYGSLTGSSPAFRENHELLEARDLEILALNDGYRVTE